MACWPYDGLGRRPHELYNGLTELLGPERAETLMAYLPQYDPADVARRGDIDRLENRFDRLEDEIGQLRGELRTELSDGLAAVNARLDRLFLALIAGLFVVLAAMAGLVATIL